MLATFYGKGSLKTEPQGHTLLLQNKQVVQPAPVKWLTSSVKKKINVHTTLEVEILVSLVMF